MFNQKNFSVLILNVYFFYLTKSQIENDEKYFRAIQFFSNCECIPYYKCSEVNNYMITARSNFIPEERKCQNLDFICCTILNNTNIVTTTETIIPNVSETMESNVDVATTTTETIIVPNTKKSLLISDCGIAKTQINLRILNPDSDSVDTIPGEVPWIVAIFQNTNNPQNLYEFQGIGTLIHPKVVLTAAHCILAAVRKPKTLKIVATGLESFQEIGVNPNDERDIAKIIKHPNFYSGGLYNDIALLILENEYNFTNNLLNSICLPKVNQSFTGRRCIAAGWGLNTQTNSSLRKVDLPIVDSNQCQKSLRKIRQNFKLHSSFVCAGGEEGKDTCRGDGGGPLMCFGDNQFVQTGIVSYGLEGRCGHIDEPGLYTDVGKFVEWINDELLKVGLKI